MDYLNDIIKFFEEPPNPVTFSRDNLERAILDPNRTLSEDDFLHQFNPDNINALLKYFPYPIPLKFYSFSIDFMLKKRNSILNTDTKYLNIIEQYFTKLHKSSGKFYLDIDEYTEIEGLLEVIDEDLFHTDQRKYLSDEEKYKLVLNTISKLWVSSDKNPSIFSNSSEFEPILQNSIQYRDHFLHSFNVYLIGYYIINRINQINSDIFNMTGDQLNLTWMLCSTFHDVAYPIQEIESWMNELFSTFFGINLHYHFKINDLLPPIYTDLMKLISMYNKQPFQSLEANNFQNIDWNLYNTINSDLISRKEHGILGSLILSHLLAIREGFSERDENNFLYTHLPACHAICLHHLENFLISFKTHPFAFILILSDELQDWGRPSNRDQTDDFHVVDIHISNQPCPEINIKLNISKSKEEKLRIALSTKRLKTNGKIKIVLKNLQNEDILKIDN